MRKVIIILVLGVMLCGCASKKVINQAQPTREQLAINAAIIEATNLLQNEDLEQAERKYLEVLKLDSKNAAAMYYLSFISFYRQDVAKAIDYGKKAIQLDKNNIWYRLQLAQIHMAIMDLDKAAEVFEDIVKIEPDVLEHWQQLAAIYHAKRDHIKEIDVLDRMEKRFFVNETTSMQKFYLYRSLKDNKKAEREIENLIKAYPEQSQYYSILATMKMEQKDYVEAMRYLQKVQSIDPDNENINIDFADYYMHTGKDDSVYYYLQKAALQDNISTENKIQILFTVYGEKVDSDTEVFNKFFSIIQTMQQVDSNNCTLHALLSRGYMRNMDLRNASEQGLKAISLGCDDYDMCVNTLLSTRDISPSPEEVLSLANKIIDLYPEQALAYIFRGEALKYLDSLDEAMQSLNTALYLATDVTTKENVYVHLADCYFLKDEKEHGLEYYDKALKLNADNVYVLNNYAYFLAIDNKDLDKAEEMILRAIKLFKDDYNLVDTYAWVLYMQGRVQEAKAQMDKIPKSAFHDNAFQEHYDAILKKLKEK